MDGGGIAIELDRAVYSITACLRAAHDLSGDYVVKVEDSEKFIHFLITGGDCEKAPRFVVGRVLRMVIDYTLRERLDAQTAPLRNAILATAFGNSGLPIRERSSRN